MRVSIFNSDDAILEGDDGGPAALLVLHAGPPNARSFGTAPLVVSVLSI